MASTKLEGCLTCFRRTEDFLRISENEDASGDDNVEAVFEAHFWFTKEEYQDRIVCTSCWEKIDEFHKFYCEVKNVHQPKIKKEWAEIREEFQLPENISLEGNDPEQDTKDESLIFSEVICKLEDRATPEEENQSDNNDDYDDKDYKNEATDSDEEEDDDDDEEEETKIKRPISDSESDVPLAKRKTTTRRKRKQKKDVLEFNCAVCTEKGKKLAPFDTWYQMKLHFQRNHDLSAFMFCCGRRFSTKPLYVKHLQVHDTTKQTNQGDPKKCLECNCSFKNEKGLIRHMAMLHTPEEEKQFKCDRCSKAFAQQDLLNSHITWHEEVERRNHHCEICNRYFLGAGNLRTHILAHHSTTAAGEQSATKDETEQPAAEKLADEMPSFQKRKRGTPEDVAKQEELIRQFVSLACSKCDYIGESFKELTRHALTEHKISTYSVVCCEKRFSKRFRLYEHCLRHLNPDHFKCELCDKTFTDSSGLQHHRWFIHTPASERPFKCDVCGDAFFKDYLLKAHMDRHLEKERKVHTCDQCGVTYTALPQLKTHQQNVHGALSDWVCDVCAKGFAYRALLERHRLTHTEEGLASMKMQCEKCLRWMPNRVSYNRHKRLCGNSSGPAKCDQCEHVSVNEHALKVHKKLNHSDRPKYGCRYCGKEFKKQLRLKEHEANHAGIILYKCPYCPRECNSSSNMYTHKKTAHPEKWAEAVAARFAK